MKPLDIMVILDRSGSMEDARSDHEGGLRSFVRDQRDLEGDVRFTLIQFDTNNPCEVVYDRVPLDQVGDISLIPRGGTPLLDAVGSALAHLSKRQIAEPPEATVVMIITDGQENASSEWTRARVKARIEELEKQNYKFLFLGANIDAFSEASSLGIPMGTAIQYSNQPGYAAAAYAAVTSNLTRSRTSGIRGQSMSSALDDNMSFTAAQRSETVSSTDPHATDNKE